MRLLEHTRIQTTKTLSYSALHLPNRWFALTTNRSLSISADAFTTFNLLPGTSCHSIGTSATGIPSCFASNNSSTSNIQVGRCCAGKMRCAAGREKSLNPHCVSRMCPTPTSSRIVCRPYMRILRRTERCTQRYHLSFRSIDETCQKINTPSPPPQSSRDAPDSQLRLPLPLFCSYSPHH